MGLLYRAGGCNANKLIYKTESVYVLTADGQDSQIFPWHAMLLRLFGTD